MARKCFANCKLALVTLSVLLGLGIATSAFALESNRAEIDETMMLSPLSDPPFVLRTNLKIDLLIIAPDHFLSQAERLAEWKRELGFTTKVVLLGSIGSSRGGLPTADNIRYVIQNFYKSYSLRYVILLGDVEFIPAHYRSIHLSHDTPLGTDLYYAVMKDEGYYPDIAVGR